MNYLPIFLRSEGLRVVIAGAGPFAEAKIRLILKTPALVHVFSLDEPTPAISQWACEGKLKLSRRVVAAQDIAEASIVYAAQMNTLADDRVVALAQRHGVWVNAVDRQADSNFITPAVVDRAPVVVAIGTEGSGPVLARWLKAKIEALLPSNLGAVANFARRNRNLAKQVPVGKARRTFWQSLFKSLLDSPALINQSKETLDAHLSTILDQSVSQSSGFGRVDFVGAGPGDADLITVKGSRVLHDADVIVHDRLVGQGVLDLARREALIIDVGKKGFGVATNQEEINSLIVAHAKDGRHVVRLKGGDPSVFGRLDEEIDACRVHGIHWQVIPGITAASAASASLGRSLSRRQRNTEITFLTGHSVKGFAEHEWQRLSESGRVIAIYMGRRSAQFLQSRLLMFGADPKTPVQCLTDVSLPTESHFSGHLDDFAQQLQETTSDHPLLMLLGLEGSVRKREEPTQSAAPLLNVTSEVQHDVA